MITAAIFDIDGTLLDSMDMWNHAGEEYLHSLGIQPKPGLAERMMPLSTPKSAQLLQREYALEKSVSEIIDGINGTVRSAYLHTVLLKPGVKDFLEEMKSKKIPMTAATSTDRCVIEGALARLGISDYFAHLFTCTEVGAGKLKPDIYIAAQEFMHSSRNSTWVFEDSLFAAKTARAAGFMTNTQVWCRRIFAVFAIYFCLRWTIFGSFMMLRRSFPCLGHFRNHQTQNQLSL